MCLIYQLSHNVKNQKNIQTLHKPDINMKENKCPLLSLIFLEHVWNTYQFFPVTVIFIFISLDSSLFVMTENLNFSLKYFFVCQWFVVYYVAVHHYQNNKCHGCLFLNLLVLKLFPFQKILSIVFDKLLNLC